jgi:short subunit dehydrogenase-like uncharacterized protein
MSNDVLIYGANGYTGRLIVKEAIAKGLRPILSGRNADAINAMARELSLEARPAALDFQNMLDNVFEGVAAVIHCAGPFSRTAKIMADTCIRTKTHYLDITGEIAVFEMLAARSAEAARSGVMLLPGVGFDVVPSDCLAAHVHHRLTTATSLALGIHFGSSPSRRPHYEGRGGLQGARHRLRRQSPTLRDDSVGRREHRVPQHRDS